MRLLVKDGARSTREIEILHEKKIFKPLQTFTNFITINYEFSSFARQIFLMC